jgi:phospholipase/lecithinase/hemolysin
MEVVLGCGMRDFRSVWLAAAALVLTGMGAQSQAPSQSGYRMLFVFGDSYSDSGAGYIDADGPTAVVYMAQKMKIPFTFAGDRNAAGKGINFAVSGAKTGAGDGKRYPHGEFLGYGMKNQVEDFAALVKAGKVTFDARETMFYFAGGLNDRGTAEGYTSGNIEAEIEELYGLGARRFEVALLPVKIPAFASAGVQFNASLARIPGEMRARHPDMAIANSNWGAFFDEVMEHPAKYGITDTTNACAGRAFLGQTMPVCGSPGSHYYYNAAHPSTAVHKAVGEMLWREAMGKG